MKKVQLLILGLLICGLSTSQTHVSGTIDGETWTHAGSPYIMDADLLIASLIIEPGVTVMSNGDYVIEVAGIINSVGTVQDSIIFTTTDTIDGWQGIHFNVTTFDSKLKYCKIEYSLNSGIRVINSTPVIENCVLSNNSASTGGAIYLLNDSETGSEFILSECSFMNNNSSGHGGALYVNLTAGQLILEDIRFERNTSNPLNSLGNFVGGAIYLKSGDLTIRNSTFNNNRSNSRCSSSFDCSVTARGGAIYLGSTGNITLENNIFLENQANASGKTNCFFGGTAYSFGGAVYVNAGTVTISNNIFAYNRTTRTNCGPSTGGGGVYVNGGTVTMTNCNVIDNPDASGVHCAVDTMEIINSIIFFNNQELSQVGGNCRITYSNIQDGYTGEGNISSNPVFIKDDSTFHLTSISPCIDAGNPDTLNDGCFPPSLGNERNDIGAYGGPGACNWLISSDIQNIENDLAVQWVEPVGKPLCGTNKEQPIIVEVANNGARAVTNFQVGYSIDGGENFVNETVFKTIQPGGSLDYTFRRFADMADADSFKCIATVSIPHDIDHLNDTISETIVNDRMIILLEKTDTECNKAEGAANITSITGRPGPFEVFWTSGDKGMKAENLASGVYFVTVSDAIGCSWTKDVAINDLGAPEISLPQSSINDISCYGLIDGSISITPIQGTPPYSYQWSNGETTRDLNWLGKGQYDITITDSEGCAKTHSFFINEPSDLKVRATSIDASCGELTGSAEIQVKGGTAPYAYFWDSGHTTSKVTGLAGGIYDVTVKDNNWCFDSAKISINEIDAPTLVVTSIDAASCGSSDGAISINMADESYIYAYSWSDGTTTKDMQNAQRGFYTVTVSFDDGSCATNEIIEIPEKAPDPGEICMVTVDSVTGGNIIIMKDLDNPTAISSYNVYKLSKTGTYQYFDSEDPSTSTTTEDAASNMEITSYRYRITLVDDCGNESEPSPFHETMHTVVSPDFSLTRANVFWNAYKGIEYGAFQIYRYSGLKGLEIIDTVPYSPDKNFYTYTDLNPPLNDTLYYVIAINLSEPCISNKKAATHNTVRSNKSKKLKFGGGTYTDNSGSVRHLNIFPNPNQGSFKVRMELISDQDVVLRVYDTQGRMIKNLQHTYLVGTHEEFIELNVRTGLYYLQVLTNDGITLKPFVVQ